VGFVCSALFFARKEGKTLTYTVQPLTWTIFKNAEKTKKTEAEKNIDGSIDRNILDGNIRELLSICDSLNKLCDTLNRLEYVLNRNV